MPCVVDDGVAADGGGRAANKEVVDKTEMEEDGEEGEGNNADAVISEGHNNLARNTTILQMLKTRDLIVCLSCDICSPRETFSLPLSQFCLSLHRLSSSLFARMYHTFVSRTFVL